MNMIDERISAASSTGILVSHKPAESTIITSPSTFTLQPILLSIPIMTSTSLSLGQFLIMLSLPLSRDAAKIGKTAFLEPSTSISPWSLAPPEITNLLIKTPRTHSILCGENAMCSDSLVPGIARNVEQYSCLSHKKDKSCAAGTEKRQ